MKYVTIIVLAVGNSTKPYRDSNTKPVSSQAANATNRTAPRASQRGLKRFIAISPLLDRRGDKAIERPQERGRREQRREIGDLAQRFERIIALNVKRFLNPVHVTPLATHRAPNIHAKSCQNALTQWM